MNRRQRLVLVGVLGVLGLMVGGAVALRGLAEPGGPLPYARRDIPVEQNGWPVLMAACELRVKAQEGISTYPVAAPPASDVLDHLTANEAFLAKVDEALEWPDLEMPDDTELGCLAVWPWLPSLRDYARLKTQVAFGHAAKGHGRSALEELERPIVLGRRVGNGSGGIINYLVGVAIENISARRTDAVLASLPPTPDNAHAAERLLARVQEGLDDSAAFRRTLLVEARYWDRHLDIVPREVAHTHPNHYANALVRLPNPWYSKARVRRLSRPYYRAVAEQAMLPRWMRDPTAFAFVASAGSSWRWMSVADDVARDSIPSIAKLFDRHDGARAYRAAAAAALALFIEHARTGQLPDDLVSASLLPAVPLDPFDGQPLRYDPTRRMIWSVGPDGVDNGGDEAEDPSTKQPRDLVYHLTFARDQP